MTDREIRGKVERAMERSLTGLRCDATLTQRVLRRANDEKGEEKVVKRISRGFILTMILLLLLATAALAVTNWDQLKGYFETVRTMENEGELARWSDEDKLKLLDAMVKAELTQPDDERVAAALDETLPLSERGAMASAIIAERYGEDYFTSYSVEQMELPEKKRTKEDQTAYEQWDEAYRAEQSYPDRQPLTESRVYLATMNNLTEIGDFPRSLLRDVSVSYVWDENENAYLVTASVDKETYFASKRDEDQISLFDVYIGGYADGDKLCFQFFLDEYGAYLGVYDPLEPENRANITLEEGRAIAEKALRVRLNVTQEELDGMTLRSSYGEGSEYSLEDGRFNAICAYFWSTPEENTYCAEIDAITGRVLQAFDWRVSEAMGEQVKAWVSELEALLTDAGVSGTLYNAKKQYFWGWSLEEKAAWSSVARPIVQKYLEEHEAFTQYLSDSPANYASYEWPNLISLTLHAYGVPDEQAVSQEEAYAIARQAALELGAKQKYIDDNLKHDFYYDVTDPDKPLWKVNLSMLYSAADTEHIYDPYAPWGYIAVIDARTGELLKMTVRTVNTPVRDRV